MILWTVQGYDAWLRMQQTGVLRADADYVWKEFVPAYNWLVAQMEVCIGPRPPGVEYPIWAWYQYSGVRRKKPDLRSSGYLSKGERGVLIEFDIQDDLVLLSNFDMWHYVLNYWYLPTGEQDSADFDAELHAHGLSPHRTKPLLDPVYHRRIVDSWNLIFDLDWVDGEGFVSCSKEEKAIQATFWELPICDVRSTRMFTAR